MPYKNCPLRPIFAERTAAVGLLNRRKFDAVIVDLQLGEQCGLILDELHLSTSNRTAVTFGIGDNDAEVTSVSARNHSLSSRDRFLRSQFTKRSGLLMGSS
jgi:hypothetical protein